MKKIISLVLLISIISCSDNINPSSYVTLNFINLKNAVAGSTGGNITVQAKVVYIDEKPYLESDDLLRVRIPKSENSDELVDIYIYNAQNESPSEISNPKSCPPSVPGCGPTPLVDWENFEPSISYYGYLFDANSGCLIYVEITPIAPGIISWRIPNTIGNMNICPSGGGVWV